MQVLRFVIACLDDKYTLSNEKIAAQSTDLLLSVLFDPPLENGLFKQSDFESEKRLLIETIKGEINDKRKYAIAQTEAIIYKDEPAGVSRYGTVEDAEKLTNSQIVAAWKEMLQNAFVRVNVVGASEPAAVYEKIKQSFSSLERTAKKENLTVYHQKSQKVNSVVEKMDVTQGKLCLAFASTKNVHPSVAVVMTDIFGGSPHSKLFKNVREKLSLCYYCAARYNNQKGVIMVDSGILEENKKKAHDSVLQQLEDIKNGEFTDEDILASKMALTDSLNTISDMPANLDLCYTNRVFTDESLQDYINAINSVTKEQIIDFAKSVELDTVYFLSGDTKDGESND